MNGWFFASVVVVCYVVLSVVSEVLEQRRRETKTGEFTETEEGEE